MGPSPEAIEVMGDKARAKETMREAGVPLVPGSESRLSGAAEAAALAAEVGYPVLLKASAGGGGRGDREEALRDGLERSQSERIRELIDIMEASDDVGVLEVEDGGVRITVRRQDDRPAAAPLAAPASIPAANGAADQAPSVSTTIKIESPMVGTFYRSPGPSDPPFVQEGDRVEVGQVLCILEAMKLFNEFKSEHAGTIRAVLAGNAEPVEYGQPLFELEPCCSAAC